MVIEPYEGRGANMGINIAVTVHRGKAGNFNRLKQLHVRNVALGRQQLKLRNGEDAEVLQCSLL